MNVASVVWNEQITNENVYSFIDETIIQATESKQNLIVFPAYIHEIFHRINQQRLNNFFIELSTNSPNLVICPGSYFEKVNGETFHSSCLIKNGKIILQQRQLYLARWERKLNLSRGSRLNFMMLDEFKVALVISTDTFYPQVIRHAKMQGANLIISPVGIIGPQNFAKQISGLWQNVQQNTLFAIESGLKGEFQNETFSSESIIHAPIDLTETLDGMLARENDDVHLISSTLDSDSLESKVNFKPLQQLNNKAYQNLF